MDQRCPALLVVAALGIVAVALPGCGGNSNFGEVSGKVSLDGNPVADALVTFTPRKGGSPSSARTDSGGQYTLLYTRDLEGAEIGEHIVKITTYQGAIKDADPPRPEVLEKIPTKYNVESQLIKEVSAGHNVIDLELKLDGPVVQPKALERMNAKRRRDG